MKFQFSIMICLSFFPTGWYVVTKGNSLSAVLCFCGLRANCLESKVTSDNELSHIFLGYLRASRRCLKFARHSSNVVFEEFVLSSLIALLLITPLFTHGRRDEVYLGVKTCEVFLCFVAIVRVRVSLFHTLCQCGQLKKRACKV